MINVILFDNIVLILIQFLDYKSKIYFSDVCKIKLNYKIWDNYLHNYYIKNILNYNSFDIIKKLHCVTHRKCFICENNITAKYMLLYCNCLDCKACIACNKKKCDCRILYYSHFDCISDYIKMNYLKKMYFLNCPLCNTFRNGYFCNIYS